MLELLRQFREREVEKTYLAIVHGEPRFDTGWIEGAIARSSATPERFEVVTDGQGREAVTWYEVRERLGSASLVECKPKTGRFIIHRSCRGYRKFEKRYSPCRRSLRSPIHELGS